MKKQKIFKFDFKNSDDKFNFYTNKTNIDAFQGIIKNNFKNIYLCGPSKSGKSYLGNMWLEINNAIKYENNFEEIINSKKNLLIDNLNNKFNEEKLFHIINHCKLENLNLLILSKYTIDEIKFKLTDLISRLKTLTFLKINQPDDDMLLTILTKLISERQFVISSHEIFQFILKNANRSYEEMMNIVTKLDTLSLEKKRQLTIPLIKEIL